jgi:hypothetical protein
MKEGSRAFLLVWKDRGRHRAVALPGVFVNTFFPGILTTESLEFVPTSFMHRILNDLVQAFGKKYASET